MQASSSTAPPKVLNDLFEVVSYNGGAQEGREDLYGIKSAFITTSPRPGSYPSLLYLTLSFMFLKTKQINKKINKKK
jgi:hypothetical protein